MKKSVLVVDDEQSILKALQMTLEGDYRVLISANGTEAAAVFKDQRPELILLDIGLPDADGLDLLKQFKEMDPSVAVIMITAVDRVKTVVNAVHLGAYDYLVKPIETSELKITLHNALENKGLKQKIQTIQKSNKDRYRLDLIGRSPQIRSLLDIAQKVSRSPETPVLIVGESGTGKGMLARAIHYNYSDAPGPFVSVYATAITQELFESELFGYEPGSFTGARNSGRIGYFEQSAEGTIFLDEIGSLSLEIQSKLLGVIEERTFYRVGGNKPIPVNSRIIAATNTVLQEAMEKGSFRKDLYYRLKVVELKLPPLRERVEDILPLAEYFIDLYNKKMGKSFRGISSEACKLMENYSWPGNVRELRNIVERIMLLESGEEMLPRHLDSLHQGDGPSMRSAFKPKAGIPDYEETVKGLISEALKLAQGNVLEAARMINLPPHKVRYRIKKYGLQV